MRMELAESVLKGNRRAIAKLISYVENHGSNSEDILSFIYPHTGRAHVVGVTGSAGVGKSCLVSSMTSEYRARGRTVGVISVDPSSPITGGAILGDRIRMQEHFVDDGVFIRSMGSRGCLGGLSKATRDAVNILDASGKDVIIVETVGAGQAEVDVANHVDTIIVTVMPGMVDDIQAIKAGISEVGDIFVVNKADLDEADITVRMLEDVIEMNSFSGWKPPVMKTVAITGEGISDLILKVDEHRKHLVDSKQLTRRREKRTEAEILEIVTQHLQELVRSQIDKNEKFREIILKTTERKTDPRSSAKKLLENLFNIKTS